jgi:hypothetical protein
VFIRKKGKMKFDVSKAESRRGNVAGMDRTKDDLI